jgi:hypothetical protein
MISVVGIVDVSIVVASPARVIVCRTQLRGA